jgi:hypothetical protein
VLGGGGGSSSSLSRYLSLSAKPRPRCPASSSRRRCGGGAPNDDAADIKRPRPRPAPRAGGPPAGPHIAGAARRRWPRAATGGQRVGADSQPKARKTSTPRAASTPVAQVGRSTAHRTGSAAVGGRCGSIQTKGRAAARGSRCEQHTIAPGHRAPQPQQHTAPSRQHRPPAHQRPGTPATGAPVAAAAAAAAAVALPSAAGRHQSR